MPRNNKDHYVSNRHLKKWADNNFKVCVLPQEYIMPFKTPIYWNDNSKKTATSDIAVMKNYSFTQENEDKVTAIEKKAYDDIIKSILKNKVLPNEAKLDPLYKLIALFLSNNPTFRKGIRDALNKNRENIIAALQALITSEDQREFFMAEIKNINPLSDISLEIADQTFYRLIKENFRFRLLMSHPKKSFITSDVPVILIPPKNNQIIFNIAWRITKFTWYYENGAMGVLEVNLNNEGMIEGFNLYTPKSFAEPIQSSGHISWEYRLLEDNIDQIYFPISPQFALLGISNMLPHNPFVMLSENETLKLNSSVLSYISNHSKTIGVGSNYKILEQSAIFLNRYIF